MLELTSAISKKGGVAQKAVSLKGCRITAQQSCAWRETQRYHMDHKSKTDNPSIPSPRESSIALFSLPLKRESLTLKELKILPQRDKSMRYRQLPQYVP